MSEPTAEQLRAAIERLEAEKQTRLQQRIDAGEVVRVALAVAGETIEDAEAKIEDAKARKAEELLAAGDKRAIHWEITTVTTGVPRDPDFGTWKPSPKKEPIISPLRSGEPEPQPEPPTEPRYVRVQVRQPTEADPGGEIAEGRFTVEGNSVRVTDLRGRLIGSALLRADADPAAVARRVLHDQNKASYEPLRYPKLGIA